MYSGKMRRWLTNLSLLIGSLLVLALVTIVVSYAAHKIDWIPESIRSALNLGEVRTYTNEPGKVGPLGDKGETGTQG